MESNSSISQHHHHHHHHHDHYARERRQRIRKRIATVLFLVLAVVSFWVIYSLYRNPDRLLNASGKGVQELEHGVKVVDDKNPHTRLDYNGIDISHYQGTVDWQRLRLDTCIQFVYLKATEGADIVDETYLDNVAGAQKVGILVGSYHYLTSSSTVEKQFQNFYNVVNRHKQGVVPVIDVEEEGVRGWTRNELQENLQRMIDLIAEHYHCTPIIYSYSRFYNDRLSPAFDRYPLFISHYEDSEPVVHGSGRHVIWQHTDKGTVDGINVAVDLDLLAPGTTLDDIRMPH